MYTSKDEFTGIETLSILQACYPKKKGLNFGLLHYYKRKGIVAPSGALRRGIYRSNYYSPEDLLSLAWLIDMKLRGFPGTRLVDGLLNKSVEIDLESTLTATGYDGPLIWTYNLKPLLERLSTAIEEICEEYEEAVVE